MAADSHGWAFRIRQVESMIAGRSHFLSAGPDFSGIVPDAYLPGIPEKTGYAGLSSGGQSWMRPINRRCVCRPRLVPGETVGRAIPQYSGSDR